MRVASIAVLAAAAALAASLQRPAPFIMIGIACGVLFLPSHEAMHGFRPCARRRPLPEPPLARASAGRLIASPRPSRRSGRRGRRTRVLKSATVLAG